jgi:hypothetical protein
MGVFGPLGLYRPLPARNSSNVTDKELSNQGGGSRRVKALYASININARDRIEEGAPLKGEQSGRDSVRCDGTVIVNASCRSYIRSGANVMAY